MRLNASIAAPITSSFSIWFLRVCSGPLEHKYDIDLVSAFMLLIVYEETEK